MTLLSTYSKGPPEQSKTNSFKETQSLKETTSYPSLPGKYRCFVQRNTFALTCNCPNWQSSASLVWERLTGHQRIVFDPWMKIWWNIIGNWRQRAIRLLKKAFSIKRKANPSMYCSGCQATVRKSKKIVSLTIPVPALLCSRMIHFEICTANTPAGHLAKTWSRSAVLSKRCHWRWCLD